MELRKMVFDGITYNVLTDIELEQIKHISYLDGEMAHINDAPESNIVSSEEFEERFKERYGL